VEGGTRDGIDEIPRFREFELDDSDVIEGAREHRPRFTKELTFSSLPVDQQTTITESELLVYVCTGGETEIKEWFQTINTVGLALKPQELLNAIYSGLFVTAAKAEYSNSSNALQQKWAAYVKGNPKRQEVLAVALSWVAASNGQSIDAYMAEHRHDTNINESSTYYTTVIDWIDNVFSASPDKSMRGLDWGSLYERYHGNSYNSADIDAAVQALLTDPAATDKKGIYEYLLGGETDTRLLNIRVFDDTVKRIVYAHQTESAKADGTSNCPLCAVGHGANEKRVYKSAEMEADHVTAWSKGGQSSLDNCEMLCVTHNRAKGNR